MTARGLSVNPAGVIQSHHRCGICGKTFSVTPFVADEPWGGCCLADECPSYDVDRDASLYFMLGLVQREDTP